MLDTPGPEGLTEEEKRVLELLARGGTSKEIADELAISPDTVRGHVQSILAKLQVHSRLEAVILGQRGSAEPTQNGGYVFWEPPHYAPEEIEAIRPDGVRVRPVMQFGGRRLGFEKPLPEGTQIFFRETLMWVVH